MGKRATKRRRESRLRRLRRRLEAAMCCCFCPGTEERDEVSYGDRAPRLPAASTPYPRKRKLDLQRLNVDAQSNASDKCEDAEAGNGDSSAILTVQEAPKNTDTGREEEWQLKPKEDGQGDGRNEIFAKKNEDLHFGEDFYIRLHANNLVTACIYYAKEELSRPLFQDVSGCSFSSPSSVSTPRSDESWESWTTSDSASTSRVSSYSSEVTMSGLSFTSESEHGDIEVEKEEQDKKEKEEEKEELGGVEFFITLHTRNIVDSAIINALLEVELYG